MLAYDSVLIVCMYKVGEVKAKLEFREQSESGRENRCAPEFLTAHADQTFPTEKSILSMGNSSLNGETRLSYLNTHTVHLIHWDII